MYIKFFERLEKLEKENQQLVIPHFLYMWIVSNGYIWDADQTMSRGTVGGSILEWEIGESLGESLGVQGIVDLILKLFEIAFGLVEQCS